MSQHSLIGLQKMIYELLTGNTPLMALLSGVYDHVPQEEAYPFIVFGDTAAKSWSNMELTGLEQSITLLAYSRANGRKSCSRIMEKMTELLHHAEGAVEDMQLLSLRYVSSKIELEKDGATYKGSLQLRGILIPSV